MRSIEIYLILPFKLCKSLYRNLNLILNHFQVKLHQVDQSNSTARTAINIAVKFNSAQCFDFTITANKLDEFT